MMSIYCGAPGSGKTYHAVAEALHRLRFGRLVVTNVAIRTQSPRYVYVDEVTLTPELLIDIAEQHGIVGREGAGLLLLDEAQLLFNSRDWRDNATRMRWLRFFTQSRKIGYDVILVAQDPRSIDRQIRDIVDQVVRHVKAQRIWWLSWIPWPIFVVGYKLAGSTLASSKDVMIYVPWIGRRYSTTQVYTADELRQLVSGGAPTSR